MKKIAFYINAIHQGGAERVIVNLANEFANRGYKCILITTYYDDWEYKLNNNVKRISIFDCHSDSLLKKSVIATIRLRKVLKYESPNVLISFMAIPNIRALISSIGLNIKNVVSIRNDPKIVYNNMWIRLTAQILYSFADKIVFQTEDAKNFFNSIIQKKSEVIYNQVDRSFYDVSYVGEKKGIVTTGRLVEQKNQRLLIKAFALIADKTSENLYIYGEGELRHDLEQLVESLNLVNRVFIRGQIEDVANTISDAKMFVLSSNYEGMPNSLLEAMALGLPCISTDCPCYGPRKIITNGYDGILVPLNNEEILAKKMLDVLVGNYPNIGENAKKTSKNFAPSKVLHDWEQLINSL